MMGGTLGMMESSLGMFDKHFSEFQQMDYNINFIRPINKQVYKELGDVIVVEYVEPKIEFPFEMKNGLKKEIVNIVGLEQNTDFYHFKDGDGKSVMIPAKGILLSENLAQELDIGKGEKLVLHSFVPGRDDVTVTVMGVIKQGLGMNAYMHIDQMADQLLDSNIATGLLVKSTDPDFVKKLNKADNIASVQSTEELKNMFQEFMGLTIVSISIMVLMAGILGFSIVYNATVISISEREMEFASMRVLGFTKKEIFRIILNENIIIALVGVMIGVPMAMSMGKSMAVMYSNEIYTMEPTQNSLVYVFSGICTFVFVFLSQLATYIKVKKLDFLQALKSRIS